MFAARLMDMHVCPMQTPAIVPIPHVGGPIIGPGFPTVMIGKMPASVMGDMCVCVGPPDSIVKGANKVLVGKRPLSLVISSMTAHGGKIVSGCFTVMVENPAAGAAGAAGAAAAAAAQGAAAAAGAVTEAAAAMDDLAGFNDEINDLLDADNLTDSQQERLDELQDDYGGTIDSMGMNDDNFDDWTD